jgi:hypothetical protein
MMQKKERIRQLSVVAAAALMIFSVAGAGASVDASRPEGAPRSDIITIDGMKVFGSLERPSVEFLHDKHTEAVEKMGKDCLVCHVRDEASGQPGIKYMRTGDTDRQDVMDIYHEGCLACHNEQLAQGNASGPVVCAGCHTKEAKTASNWQEIGMDSSLHYRHSKAMDKKCETCHHEYDEPAKKLVYVKGNEGTCRYCHGDEVVENRIALREAAHLDCVSCHLERSDAKKSAGPVQCAGCHDAGNQAAIEKVAEVPRMEMKQPDTVFVKVAAADAPAADPDTAALRMNMVPFDHKAHETYNDTCRACHHASPNANLTGCVDCHTLAGKEAGDWVNLEQAMHRAGTEASCVGCHAQEKADKTCAGCHDFMITTAQPSQTTCNTCHQVPAAETADVAEASDLVTLAAAALAAREPTLGTYDVADIPEKVTIKVLSKDYEPVELPHRKIVLTLAEGLKESELAKYFHTDIGTLCQGCHHNSPAALKPPQCASCHGQPFQESDMFRPGLMAAYHQQCMGCHDQMKIEKPAARDCAGCHKEK